LQTLKNRNLDHQMSLNAQTVSDTLSIFVHTDDKREKLKIELEKFKSLFKQIYNIGKSGKFPTLLKSLSVSEELVSSAINLAIKTTNEETVNNDQTAETEDWKPDILRGSDGPDHPDETNIIETSIQKSSSVRIADALLTAWVNSLTSGYDNTKVMRLLNTNMAAFEFLTGHIANEAQISRIRKTLETKFDSWTYGETLDANLTAYAKIASETINQHILLREKTEDKNSVSSETISEFTETNVAEPLGLWKTWISSFGQTIETNCSSTGQSSFDPIQNDVLVTSLNELQIA